MVGRDIRLGRLFTDGKNAVVVAVDHGEYLGPIPGLIDLPAVIERAAGADAILLAPGMVRHCAHVFSRRGGPLAMVRLNWSSVYATQWAHERGIIVPAVAPQQAVGLGADIALASLTLTMTDETTDAANVEVLFEIANECREYGLPLVGELWPVNAEELPADELHRQVYIGARMIAEIGVDAIKTFYTGERFPEVAEATPVPILALGGTRGKSDLDGLRIAEQAVRGGAGGVVFGRSVIQAPDPPRFLAALSRVVKDRVSAEDAAREFGLT